MGCWQSKISIVFRGRLRFLRWGRSWWVLLISVPFNWAPVRMPSCHSPCFFHFSSILSWHCCSRCSNWLLILVFLNGSSVYLWLRGLTLNQTILIWDNNVLYSNSQLLTRRRRLNFSWSFLLWWLDLFTIFAGSFRPSFIITILQGILWLQFSLICMIKSFRFSPIMKHFLISRLLLIGLY